MKYEMNTQNSKTRIIEWLSLLGAIVAGPVCLAIVNALHGVYAVAGFFYFLFCATVIPLLAFAAGRFKFLVWQVAVVSLIVATIQENGGMGAIGHRRELFTMIYLFWFFSSLVSSPLLIYYRLKPLPNRRRLIEGAIFAVAALALYGGVALLGH